MRTAPDNVAPLEEALHRLSEGLSAGHTPTGTYDQVMMPIIAPSGLSINLVWPDYAGEQIQQIVNYHRVSPEWQRHVLDAQGWLLFIRLTHAMTYEDPLTRPPLAMDTASRRTGTDQPVWEEQVFLVELLQILLYCRGIGTLKRTDHPALGVVLSCWDELSDEDQRSEPAVLLSRRMPLFADFVSATWTAESYRVFGLSSLGKTLRTDMPDEAYMDEGPEQFGYIVLPDGSRTPDLTLPVATLMEQLE